MKNKLLKTRTSNEYNWFRCIARIYETWMLDKVFTVNAYVCDASTWSRLSKIQKYTYRNLTLDRIIEGLEEINKIQQKSDFNL